MPIGDFSSLAGTLSGGMTEQGGAPTGSPLGDNMSAMSGLMGYQQDQANEPPPKIKMETDEKGQPQWSVDLSDSQMKGIMGKMSYLEKALQAMTAETSRLQAEENRARQNPLLHVLTTVAGNLAAGDPRLPPAVSALGRASLQLNPQPEALAQRRMGLEEQIGRTASLGAEVGLRGAQFDLDVKREARLERRAQADLIQQQHNENTKIFRDLGIAAQKGEITDAKITAKVLENAGAKPEVAAAQAEQLAAVSQAKRELDAAAAATKDKREAALLAEKAREADQHMATILAAAQLHTDAALKLADFKAQEAEKRATLKTDADRKKVPPAVPKDLDSLNAAEKALDEVEAGLKKYAKYQGPIAGRTLEPIGAYLNPEVSKFFTKMKLQVAQAIKSTGAGARGFGPMERGFFEQLAESKNHPAAQNLGIIEAWRDYIRQNRSSKIEVYEGLRDPKWKRAFGKDAAELFKDSDADPLGVLK